MKIYLIPVVLLTGLLIYSGSTFAAPENGFGLYGGFASHSSDGVITAGAPTGTEFEFSSSGLSIGIDYQFALGDSFSISPFLVSSSESFTDETGIFVENDGGSHGIIGVQFRLWFEDVFVGAHVGNYSEVIRFSTSDVTSDGPGFGVIAGWEGERGLFFSAQYDQASLEASDADIDLTGIRLHIGYRWK